MKIKLGILVILALLLFGCGQNKYEVERNPNQELRRELFFKCLEKAPAGPVATKYNDWSEVVNACGDQAYYLSLENVTLKLEEKP